MVELWKPGFSIHQPNKQGTFYSAQSSQFTETRDLFMAREVIPTDCFIRRRYYVVFIGLQNSSSLKHLIELIGDI